MPVTLPADLLINCIMPFLVFERTLNPNRIGVSSCHRFLQLRKWSPAQVKLIKFRMSHILSVNSPPLPTATWKQWITVRVARWISPFGTRVVMSTRWEESNCDNTLLYIWNNGRASVKAVHPIGQFTSRELSPCGRHWIQTIRVITDEDRQARRNQFERMRNLEEQCDDQLVFNDCYSDRFDISDDLPPLEHL